MLSKINSFITTISQIWLNTHANPAELGIPKESTNYIWHPMQHAIECFHTYIDNNESHKYHISDYYYIIKCYLKLLVTFCHTLLHKLTYTDTLNESESVQHLAAEPRWLRLPLPLLPNGDISRNTSSNENYKKICQNHKICQADFSLTNLTKIH